MVSTVLFEDQDRLVRLDVTFREGGQEHSHPARVKSIRLARVLRSITLTPPGPLLPAFRGHHRLAGSPAFSEGEIEFLAPLFEEGLRRSTPLEEVVFYLSEIRDSGVREITSGSLYVQNEALHLRIANYRSTTTGELEAARVRTNPLTILGEHQSSLDPGPDGRIQPQGSWTRIMGRTPQHLVFEYRALKGARPGTEGPPSDPETGEASTPRLRPELYDHR